jgi:mannose-6-phosphate isomerase-like protein (cupin superfamily)
MKHIKTSGHRKMFSPLIQSTSVQAAMMVLKPGQSSSDEPENEHPRAEQWLYVVSGSAKARVGVRSIRLNPGSLLLIEKGESHKITAAGKTSLVTVNFYAPPAYTADGEVKPAVKRH